MLLPPDTVYAKPLGFAPPFLHRNRRYERRNKLSELFDITCTLIFLFLSVHLSRKVVALNPKLVEEGRKGMKTGDRIVLGACCWVGFRFGSVATTHTTHFWFVLLGILYLGF